MTEEGLATPSQPNPLGCPDIDVHCGKILTRIVADFGRVDYTSIVETAGFLSPDLSKEWTIQVL